MFPLSDANPSHKFPLINIIIIAVTSLVFFLQLSTPDEESFIFQYALVPSQVNLADFYSLIPFVTAMFLHGGFLHIISNMWFLWIFGDNIEGHFGWLTFVILYFVSGIVGNVAQYILMPNSPIPMLGASGAVAGILGAYFILFPHAKIRTLIPYFGFISIVALPASLMLGYWFVLQIISGAVTLPTSGEGGGVAFWAHVGGFVTGIIFAKMLKKENSLDNY